ncbi:basement membrane-specific heparan sulfate proteoglycan core protein isoform X2 [Gasterosteus aculeatus]
MMLVKVLSVIYFTACAAQNSDDHTTAESSFPLSTPVYVTEPPVPSLQRRSERSDVFPSEKVELSCSVPSSAAWTFSWYRDTQQVQNTDPNVALSPDGSNLIITAATQSYSGMYSCKAHTSTSTTAVTTKISNSIKITVHANKPKPTLTRSSNFDKMFPGESVTFTCKVDVSDGWVYLWYHYETQVQASSIGTYTIASIDHPHSGKYHCQAKRANGPFHTEESDTTALHVSDPPKPSLKLLSPWPDVFENETVEFRCEVHSPDWTISWNKGGNEPGYELDEIQNAEGPFLNLTGIHDAYEGGYTCKAHLKSRGVSSGFSNTVNITVYDHTPIPALTRVPDFNPMYVGETVNLKCEVNLSSGWKYQWYKNGIEQQTTKETNSIKLSLSDRGKYQCRAARGEIISTEFSEEIKQDVLEIPVPSSKSATPLDVFPGESVKLSCAMAGGADWTFSWFKDKQPVRPHPTTSFDVGAATLSIRSASASHGGQYSCLGKLKSRPSVTSTSSPELTLSVYGNQPKPLMTQVPDVKMVYTGESVSFECKVQLSSGWRYQWSKDGKQLPNNNSSRFNISHATSLNNGTYECSAMRDKTMYNTSHSDGRTIHVSEIPVPSLKSVTPWLDVFPGESVKLCCAMAGGADWTLLWFKDKQPVRPHPTTSFDVGAATLSISSASASHGGQYSCSGNLKSRPSVISTSSPELTLSVYGNQPKPLMTQVPDVKMVYTGESVSFKCKVQLSSGWRYQWSKDGKQLPNNNSSSFNISHANSLNNGTYECSAMRDKTMYNTSHGDRRTIHVSEIPVPSLKSVTPWLDVFPGESVKLSCAMAGGADWTFSWFKDKQLVRPHPTTSFDVGAATLSIRSASASHGGQYSCLGKLKSRPSVISTSSPELTLSVYDAKPRVTLMQNPIHNVMHTEESVSFSCHINVSSGWEYLWLKDRTLLPESGKNHTIESVETKNTGSYQCQAKRGRGAVFSSDQSPAVRLDVKERPQAGITLLTGWSEVFSTDSLVLNCEVHGSQDMWNYTWYKADQLINLLPSKKHTVTPQNDPEQSQYTCRGISTGRPSYSRRSDSLQTKNLLLKRRVLLSISGCIVFGIAAVFLGCILLRVFRKSDDSEDKPAENELFLTMAQLRERDDATCPMVQYITDAELNAPSKEADENGTICSETTEIPITSQDEHVVTSETEDVTEKNGGLISFK